MAVRVFKIGSGVTDTPADIIIGGVNIGGGANFMTLESPIGTDIQVAAGKTLFITRLHVTTAVAATIFRIGYGDDGVPDQAGAPTASVNVTFNFRIKNANDRDVIDLFVPIPAGKFPWIKLDTVAAFFLNAEGIEI